MREITAFEIIRDMEREISKPISVSPEADGASPAERAMRANSASAEVKRSERAKALSYASRALAFAVANPGVIDFSSLDG